ncbi:hypothetical protein MNBD_BACTEROID02-117, partial [hydrothermal vent metagenome]
MKIKKITLYVFCIIVGFTSCSKKDNTDDFVLTPERDRAEQQIADKDSLIGYLETHYYNSGTFINSTN